MREDILKTFDFSATEKELIEEAYTIRKRRINKLQISSRLYLSKTVERKIDNLIDSNENMDRERRKFESSSLRYSRISLVISVIGLILTTSAIIFTGYQLQATMKHNRLSFKPIVQLELSLAPYESRELIGLYIRNDGYGPAILETFTVHIDDQRMSSDGFQALREAAVQFGLYEVDDNWTYASNLITLPASEARCVFGIPLQDLTKEKKDMLNKLFSSASIYVRWRSIYGDIEDAHFSFPE